MKITLKKNLLYFWRINLAVLSSAMLATSVLTGALLVGDSVRGSLQDLTLDRLGSIDYALAADRFVREDLSSGLLKNQAFKSGFDKAVPAILLSGSAIQANTKSRASGLNILGMDERFLTLYPSQESDSITPFLQVEKGQVFPSLVINQALQKELGANVGDQVLLRFQRTSDVHRESVFGSKNNDDIVQSLRLAVTKVLPNRGLGRFGLRPHQSNPLNAYVLLNTLQKALGQESKINALFISQSAQQSLPGAGETLQNILQESFRLEDYDLTLRTDSHHTFFAIESKQFMINSYLSESLLKVAGELNVPAWPIITYLANTLEAKYRTVPYSTVTAIQAAHFDEMGELDSSDGEQISSLEGDGILLNSWAARELAANAGDSLWMNYYVAGSGRDQSLLTESHGFLVQGILKMSGLASDSNLTPDFPGIHDADNIQDWNPPFPVDLDLIRPQDEVYWDEYRATPKAFVSFKTARRLWSSRFGNLTSIRFAPIPGLSLHASIEKFESELLKTLEPGKAGFVFQPVKKQGLGVSKGATDFSTLFIGFSFFLIIAAALLVSLLFRLGLENRAREIGLLLSTGYPPRQIRSLFMKESLLLAGLGCLLGLAGAIGYAWLIMAALRDWWTQAVGTSYLFLHVRPVSLILGYLIGLFAVLLTIRLSIRQLTKLTPGRLLSGLTAEGNYQASAKWMIAGIACIILAIGMALFAELSKAATSVGLFFASGTLLLTGLLALTWHYLTRPVPEHATAVRIGNFLRMAMKSGARNPRRSMLCVALVACACFVIVSVGANRTHFTEQAIEKNSGTGGFTLMAESDIPLLQNLNSSEGRFELGISDDDTGILNASHVIPFRLLPGEDASCLNLYQPQKPRVLGVPQEMISRGGFSFQSIAGNDAADNPWELLTREPGDSILPAIGDYNSVRWILHLGLGEDLAIQNQYGREIKLRLVGLLNKSIFQSELLISEENFLKHFPNSSGYSYFLIETTLKHAKPVGSALENALSDYGFDVTSTTDRLASYQAVENTYLSVFQTLGGFGLLLGTLGLGIVLFRNVIERRGELAAMRAFGFLKKKLSRMLLAEHSLLIAWGILLGSFSALVAVMPHLLQGPGQLPRASLFLTLTSVMIFGTLASAASASRALKTPLLPALKAERGE